MFRSALDRKIERQIDDLELLLNVIEKNADKIIQTAKGREFLIGIAAKAQKAKRLMNHFIYKKEREKRVLIEEASTCK